MILRDKLLHCLDEADDPAALAEAKRIYKEVEQTGEFKTGVNLQFLLSSKARIFEKEEHDPASITSIIMEGIKITFPEFDEKAFSGEVLIFEEIELLHTLSFTYRRSGKLSKAVKLLSDVLKGIEALPEDDREKIKKQASIMLTLSSYLIESGEYAEALRICEGGNEATLKYCRARHASDFAYNKAVCLFHLNRHDECGHFLTLAYFGYVLLQKRDAAEKVLADAAELYGVRINTYGTDTLEYAKRSFTPFAYGEQAVGCKHIGQVIEKFRIKARLKRIELCRGICSKETLYKIEKGGGNKGKYDVRGIITPNIYVLEALMQRLGRDINLYYDSFLSGKDFKEKQMRNEIIALNMTRKFEEAEALINELETRKAFKSGVNLQFIMSAKATAYAAKEGYNEKYFFLIQDALKLTIPDFDIRDIHRYRLSYNEIVLINKMALYYGENGNILQAVKIYERLKDCIDANCLDEFEKIRMYVTIVYNLTKDLGLMERFTEALDIIAEGEQMAIKHSQLSIIPGLMINKACDLFEQGKGQESIPYFAMAYYGSELVSKQKNQTAVIKYVKDKLNLTFC
jgi:tetratricopeptide (TPR) repeat protein